MKSVSTLLIFFLFCFFSLTVTAQEDQAVIYQVVPPDYSGTAGTTAFLGPLANSQRTYQLLINESLLTGIVGKEIQAISWRLPSSASANWPTAEVTYSTYDVYFAESVHPSQRSLTLDSNVVGTRTLTRSGALVIPVDSYTFGNSPNAWGPEIMLNSYYLYNGGHLLVEIRHQGFTGTSRSIDAIGTSITGYGTLFSAAWQGAYVPTTGSQGNFGVVRLTADDPIPVELTSFTASVSGATVNLNWTTATELNNLGFDVQRKSAGSDYTTIGFVGGAGSTTEQRSYYFSDEVNNGTYTYRLKQNDFDGSYQYSHEIEVNVDIPATFTLGQNYPNPFNPTTRISYSLAEAGFVKLAVYDLLGREVMMLVNENKEAGEHSVMLDASSLTSGAYFYKIETQSFIQTKKMILAK